MVVLVIATAALVEFGRAGNQTRWLGPRRLADPDLPMVSFTDIVNLLPIATGVALVAFVDTTITGRAFAMKGGYRLDHNQELIALGLANVGTGLSRVRGGVQPLVHRGK